MLKDIGRCVSLQQSQNSGPFSLYALPRMAYCLPAVLVTLFSGGHRALFTLLQPMSMNVNEALGLSSANVANLSEHILVPEQFRLQGPTDFSGIEAGKQHTVIDIHPQLGRTRTPGCFCVT